MNILNSAETIGAVALGLVVGMIILLILQARSSTQINKLTFPAYEYTIKKAENEANEIIEKAQEQAREIIASAELESRSSLTDRIEKGSRDYEAYMKSLEELRENLVATLTRTVESTEVRAQEMSDTFVHHLSDQDNAMRRRTEELADHLNEIPEHLRAQTRVILEGLQERIARAGEQLEHSLITSHNSHTEAIKEHLQTGFEIAERDIEEYRKGRKKLIDNHIEVLVKDVVRVALQKELTRADHAELVRSALEEARSSGSL